MKIYITAEVAWMNDASTVIDVPDDATDDQIGAAVDTALRDNKINWPDKDGASRASTVLLVYRANDAGDAVGDAIDSCERYW